MRQYMKYIRYAFYAILLIVLIGGAYKGLSSIPYFKEYVDGFIVSNIKSEGRTHHFWVDENTGRSDIAYILDVQDSILSNRRRLSELVESIMSHNPSVLGLDIELTPNDPVEDSMLYNALTRYDNIVLPYDREKEVFPLGKTFDDFPNVCYTNFGALEDMPRYLAPYVINQDGRLLTSFWARLWEIHANIPNGQLKSRREFIDFNIKPVIHSVNRFEDLQSKAHSSFQDLTDKIVIIGNIKGESGSKDVFHVPIMDSWVAELSGRHLMTGIEIIGSATLSIGDNELDNSILDRNRKIIGYGGFLILVIIFCLIHFMDGCSMIRIIREYGNCFQFVAGLVLYAVAKTMLSPSLDEQWYFFSIVAVFLLLVPFVADFEKALYKLYKMIRRKFENGIKS